MQRREGPTVNHGPEAVCVSVHSYGSLFTFFLSYIYNRGSCSPGYQGYPQTPDPSVYIFQMLGLLMCTTLASLIFFFLILVAVNLVVLLRENDIKYHGLSFCRHAYTPYCKECILSTHNKPEAVLKMSH